MSTGWIGTTAAFGGIAAVTGGGIGLAVLRARSDDPAPKSEQDALIGAAKTAAVSAVLAGVGIVLALSDRSDFPARGALGAILTGFAGLTAAGAVGYGGTMLGAHLLDG